MQPLDEEPLSLSIHRAFVLHVRDDSSLETGQITGRVEHIVSGAVTDFTSVEALLAFLIQVLPPGEER